MMKTAQSFIWFTSETYLKCKNPKCYFNFALEYGQKHLFSFKYIYHCIFRSITFLQTSSHQFIQRELLIRSELPRENVHRKMGNSFIQTSLILQNCVINGLRDINTDLFSFTNITWDIHCLLNVLAARFVSGNTSFPQSPLTSSVPSEKIIMPAKFEFVFVKSSYKTGIDWMHLNHRLKFWWNTTELNRMSFRPIRLFSKYVPEEHRHSFSLSLTIQKFIKFDKIRSTTASINSFHSISWNPFETQPNVMLSTYLQTSAPSRTRPLPARCPPSVIYQ